MFYKIKKIYRYTEIVVVEADTRQDALDISNAIDTEEGPEYECLYDATILSQSEDPIEL